MYLDDFAYQGRVKENGSYLTFQSNAPLNYWVNCFWELNVAEGEFYYRSIPDNCIDWIFNLNDPEDSFIITPFLSFVEFQLTGPAAYFGIRFRALGYQGLIDAPIGEWLGSGIGVDAIEVVRRDVLDALYYAVDKQVQFDERCRRVGKVLLGALQCPKVDLRLARFIRYYYQETSPVSMLTDKKCSDFGVSSRQLRRLSQLFLGLSPKEFLRVLRFQKVLHLMKTTGNGDAWADCYYDQSHYIKEFKSLTGLTPKKFMSLSVLYNK